MPVLSDCRTQSLAAVLHPAAAGARGDPGRRFEHNLRGHGLARPVRQVEEGPGDRHHFRASAPHRKEHPPAEGHPDVRQLHVHCRKRAGRHRSSHIR